MFASGTCGRGGSSVSPLIGHTQSITGLALSPDGSTLATAALDKTVRLWDVRSFRRLGDPLAGSVYAVAFSPDGRTLAGGGFDGKVRLWEGIFWDSPAELRERICSLVWGNLTENEWQQYVPGLPYRASCPS